MKFLLLKLLELSLQAGVLTLAILLVRLVFKKLPAKYLCVLWAIVAARLTNIAQVTPCFALETCLLPRFCPTKVVTAKAMDCTGRNSKWSTFK